MNDKNNTIQINGSEIKVTASVFLFKEGNAFIAYCPSLDICGYDLTEDGAKQDLEYVIKEWLKEQTEKDTLRTDLEKHGWKVCATMN